MDCRETQTMLCAFHDGELPAADRARVEEHLRGCRACAALLADLAQVDQAAGVPDPGPAYWDRFNARVMDRIEREADGPKGTVLRPKHGWMRQQLRYIVPAAAAAAMVVMVVRYGGRVPVVPTPSVPPAVSEPATTAPAEQRMAKAEAESRATIKEERTAAPVGVPPPVLDKERFAAEKREDRDRLADRSLLARTEETRRGSAAAPAAMSAPSPAPPMAFRGAPAASPPVTAASGIHQEMQAERKKMAEADSRMDERQAAGMAKSASVMGAAVDRSAETPPAAILGKARSEVGSERVTSPCDLARALADEKHWKEAETAQRACLAQDRSAPAQEKGLVFLAELLDRQARFAEADAVITEVDRQFPQSLPLDLYRQRRPMVQKQPWQK